MGRAAPPIGVVRLVIKVIKAEPSPLRGGDLDGPLSLQSSGEVRVADSRYACARAHGAPLLR